MKKFFTLIAMLVSTVAAMATTYTADLVGKVQSTTFTNNNQTMTIEATAENEYTVTLPTLNTYDALYMELGTITFTGVTGTTTDGVTTINVEKPTASMTDAMTGLAFNEDGNLEVKFTEEKAYLHYTGSISYMSFMNYDAEFTYGTDDFGGGTVEPDQPTVVATTDYSDALTTNLNIDGEDNEGKYTDAKLKLEELSDGTFTATFTDVTAGHLLGGGEECGDIVVKGLVEDVDEDGNEIVTLKTPATITLSSAADYSALYNEEFTVNKLDILRYTEENEDGGDVKECAYALLSMNNPSLQSHDVTVDLTYGTDPTAVDPDEPEEVDVVTDYQADGTGFSFTEPINWDTQKLVASIDLTNCSDDKDFFAMTTEGGDFSSFHGTAANPNMHWYYSTSRSCVQGYWANGSENNNSGDVALSSDKVMKFEWSKANGLLINGETVVNHTAETLSLLFESNKVVLGSGESGKQSNAFYNFIKIVPLDWEWPTTDGISTVNTTVAAPAQIFTVNGMRVNTLQKGINIVRTADGKTIKVMK